MPHDPKPVDYYSDDRVWARHIVGIFFVLLGVIITSGPWLTHLPERMRAIIAIVGFPMMVRGVPSVFWSVIEGLACLVVGVGVLRNWRWVFAIGMLLAEKFAFSGGPAWWILGPLAILWLWTGMPPKDADPG